MKKIIKKYRLEDIGKQEDEEIKYWDPISTSKKPKWCILSGKSFVGFKE